MFIIFALLNPNFGWLNHHVFIIFHGQNPTFPMEKSASTASTAASKARGPGSPPALPARGDELI